MPKSEGQPEDFESKLKNKKRKDDSKIVKAEEDGIEEVDAAYYEEFEKKCREILIPILESVKEILLPDAHISYTNDYTNHYRSMYGSNYEFKIVFSYDFYPQTQTGEPGDASSIEIKVDPSGIISINQLQQPFTIDDPDCVIKIKRELEKILKI